MLETLVGSLDKTCIRYKWRSEDQTDDNGIQRDIKVKGQKLGTVGNFGEKPTYLGSKVKLMHSLVISIFLYTRDSWALTAKLEKRTLAVEKKCYRRLLDISYKDHEEVTNPSSHCRI